MLRNYLAFCTTALLIIAGCSSIAQAKPKEPEAQGFQAGNFILHPGVDIAAAYDVRGSRGFDDGFVDLGAHLKTRLADEKYHSWDNNISFNWRQFWGIGDAKAVGGPNVYVTSSADLFKESFFRIAPSVSYTYEDEPEDDYLRKDYEHHRVRAGVNMFLQPGGGAIFSQKIGYKFYGTFYSDYSDGSNITNRVDSVTRWNFLPQSSMALIIDFRAISYLEDEHRLVGVGGVHDTTNYSSFPVRVSYSLQGLLFARFSYVLGLGYAYENHTNSNNEHMFIMNARLRYDFTERVSLFVEYRKDFDNITFGDYYKLHRVNLGFDALWADHLWTKLGASFGAFDFRTLAQNPRDDYLITLDAAIYYHFLPGLKLGLDYRLRDNLSDYSGSDYVKHLILLNFSYEY